MGGIERGAQLGRYVILDRVGEGGMGEVYAAYDPELDRRVALKLLKSDRDDRRLLREAQALARLSHPNVVAIHDVGSHEGRVFLAMDYIAGQTLREWLAEKRRGWRETLAVLVHAGTGLAAAHAAGLVHRDFKPDNVLVRRDGHVFVTDFGLARATGDGEAARQSAGRVAGTPTYMSPEQHRGDVTDASSDQFSFGVTLYEALYREAPFAAGGSEVTTATGLALEAISGRVLVPPRDAGVPAWVHKVVLRSLAPRREDRFPSLAAMLAALRRDPAGDRRGWLARSLVLAVIAGAAAVVAPSRAPSTRCAGGEAQLAGIWDAEVAARVRAAFDGVQRGHAADTAGRVVARLDAYASRWVAQHHETCAATSLRGERSGRLLDLGMACLERQRGELRATSELLAGPADGQLVENAVRIVDGLTAPAACADVDALLAGAPAATDAATASQVAAVRPLLERAEVLRRAGKYQPALQLARGAVASARAVGQKRLLAEALFQDGSIARDTADREGSTPSLEEAARLAAELRDDLLLARAMFGTAWNSCFLEERHDAALAMAGVAEMAAVRAHDERLVADVLDVKGGALEALGQMERAAEAYERALAIRERELGPTHPGTAIVLDDLAVVATDLGEWKESERLLRRAIAIRDENLGSDHPLTLLTRGNLAAAIIADGRIAEGLDIARAAAVAMLAEDPAHPALDAIEGHILQGHLELGQTDAAMAVGRGILARREARGGPEAVELVATLTSIGDLERLRGRTKEARAQVTRAAAIVEKLRGADHPSVIPPLVSLARVDLAEGKTDEAIAILERAVALADGRKLSTFRVTDAKIVLARALEKRDPARALALAEEAARSPKDAPLEQEIAEFMKRHR